jgi:hypothetical protein
MLVRRLLALLVAVGLVFAATMVRARLFPTTGSGSVGGEDLHVVCLREVAAACDAISAATTREIEDAATTVERFTQRDPGVDVWLTVQPWPELATAARARAGLPELETTTSSVLARSPVVIAARGDRLAVLEQACDGGRLTWRCIGETAGQPWTELDGQQAWGRVKVGLERPETTAEGLLTLSQATSDFFDGQPWTTRSLNSTDYFSWLSDFGAAVQEPTGEPPLERMLATGGASHEIVGTLEASALPLLRGATERAAQIDVVVRAVEPTVTADVVVAGYGAVGAAAVDVVAGQVDAALEAAGWRVTGSTVPADAPVEALPSDTGLPSAAALEALRGLWIGVTRG